MSSVGPLKHLLLCAALAALCVAQKTNSTPVQVAANARPAIIQAEAATAQVVSAPDTSTAQLSSANFHAASSEEINGMEQTLEHYVNSFESLDLAGIHQIWPGMDRQHEKAFKSAFSSFKSWSSKPQLGLLCAVPRVSDASANVQCSETVTYTVDKNKTKQAGPAKLSIQLKWQSGQWILQDMRGSS